MGRAPGGVTAQGRGVRRGTLMVAEVASRFEDIRAFMSAMAQLGFKSVSKVCPRAPGAGRERAGGW